MFHMGNPKRATSDRRKSERPAQSYSRFAEINGNHSLKAAVPNGYVDYEVRKRHGGKVAFFNFELAKEMGLIPADHPRRLNNELSEQLLETFSIVLINEWDIENNRKFPKKDIKPHRYMATRYLQLQHPSKRGDTSGDGRGLWNGEVKSKGVTWDVSSSGTGATCLSPAVAIQKKFFKSGDPKVCYGNGYNCVEDGFSTALMSEIFHINGIPTERTLVIIEFPGGSSINVRAAKNLLRPSHLFHHLKQGNLEGLKSAVNYLIERQVANGEWKASTKASAYQHFSEQMALSFSKLAAQFETEYVFCWLDWDGDNILANGGIIDYGSVRQFGLFHSEYRYDDVDRFSTKLAEQKLKARYMVQTCAQIRSFLQSGQRRNIRKFSKDPVLKLFDENFEFWMDELLLQKLGFGSRERDLLMKDHRTQVTSFRKIYSHFERTQCQRGIRTVADGITSDAVFSMRDCLRELPQRYLKEKRMWIEAEDFIQLMKSSYARKSDLKLTPYRLDKIREFQNSYASLVETVAKKTNIKPERSLLEITMRSSVVNRPNRVTGDGIIEVTEKMLKMRKNWSQAELQIFVQQLISAQVFDPSYPKTSGQTGILSRSKEHLRGAFDAVLSCLSEYRESL